MSNENVCSLYESVAEVTSQMLSAAQRQDWDELAELEVTCADYVEQIRDYDEVQPAAGEAYKHKLQSIKLILANDREIRNLMAPWMLKLNNMLNSGSKNNTSVRHLQM
ncbi:MAG: flagellar protein FliT [Methylophilaceae bacterium]